MESSGLVGGAPGIRQDWLGAPKWTGRCPRDSSGSVGGFSKCRSRFCQEPAGSVGKSRGAVGPVRAPVVFSKVRVSVAGSAVQFAELAIATFDACHCEASLGRCRWGSGRLALVAGGGMPTPCSILPSSFVHVYSGSVVLWLCKHSHDLAQDVRNVVVGVASSSSSSFSCWPHCPCRR